MQIILNGKLFDYKSPVTVEKLLIELNLTGKLAVEINNTIIPRSQFPSHVVQPDDKIEIVNAIGGG